MARLSPRQTALAGIALAVCLFVSLNIWAQTALRGPQLDLTANRQFTISAGTERLLTGMTEPVTLRFYRSGDLRERNPFLATYADKVRDLLDTYVRVSNGRIRLEVIDPLPFSPEEDRAVGAGIQPIPLGDGTAYLGIAGSNSTDDADAIPLLSPERERFLEYDLTRLVANLANPTKPVVAFLSTLPIGGDPMRGYQPWQIYTQLGQFFDVRQLGGEIRAIDDDVTILVVVHPKDLSETTQQAIDQFVLRGGKALVFVDPHAEAEAMRSQRQAPGAPAASSLPKLFDAWGVAFDPDKVVADGAAARQVTFPVNGRPSIVDYLPWLALDRRAVSQDDPAVAELNALTFLSAGALAAKEGATTTFEPLVQSSAESMLIDADKVRLFPDPLGLLEAFAPGGTRLTLAARLSGAAKTAFPEAAGEGRLGESRGPIDVVVIADVDLLEDEAWLAPGATGAGVPVADNAGMVLNLLDRMAGSEALLGLRSRDVSLRPFTRIQELRRDAERRYRAKEQELNRSLQDVQQKLANLGGIGQTQDGVILTAAQKQEIDTFRAQMLEIRRELRDVQLALRQDIDRLEGRLRFLVIAGMPIVVTLVAIVVALIRRARMQRRYAAPAGAPS